MNLLLVSATAFETARFSMWLSENFSQLQESYFARENLQVKLLVTGVGMAYTGICLGQALACDKFDLAINAGVAGAFDSAVPLGEVFNVISEQFGDLGVEEADGRFTDVHQLGLIDPHRAPFFDGKLLNLKGAEFDFLPTCKGLTVNRVHGYLPSIEAVRSKYGADVESMEGAAFFLACLSADVPFLEIRAISNHVEPRNRENWNLTLAIENLNQTLISVVNSLI
jgi:futalosine hydrolase